jgi:hypothetical protein
MADFDESTKAELIAQLSQARAQMTRSGGAVVESLNLPQNLRRSFGRHQTGWLVGAGFFGWLLTRLPGRRKKSRGIVNEKGIHTVEKVAGAGLLLGLLKFGASVAKPALTAFAKDKITELVRKR